MRTWLCSACASSCGSCVPCDCTSATPVSSQEDSNPNTSMVRECSEPAGYGTVVAGNSMAHTMKSGLHFLIAARECEIGDLEQLALTSALVDGIGQLVHALQRERGLSNLFLGSRGLRFAQARTDQQRACDAAAARLRAHFDAMDIQAAR